MKKPKSAKKRQSSAIIAVVLVVAISAGAIYFMNHNKAETNTSQWITSGPFSLTNSTFRLGDNVFMVVTGLKPTDTGTILIYDPHGGLFEHIPFNGTMKSDFNYFFKPVTLKSEKLCTAKDLVGNWTLVFSGTSYKSLQFRILDQYVPGAETEKDLLPVPPPC